jgi:hypothetical protein
MVTVAIVVDVSSGVGSVRMIVTVVSEREVHQRGRDVVVLGVHERITVVSCVIPGAVPSEPVVVVRVEDLVVLANHDLDAGLDNGRLGTLREREIDVGMATAEREGGGERQSDRDE